MREYRGVEVCTRCERKPEVFRRLDLEYWGEHPDRVPSCKHCGKSVSPKQLEHVLDDWYLCPDCASNREVLRYFDELRLHMSR
jgi:Zn finger protein HypA/HybF involved in hydrogenase expression